MTLAEILAIACAAAGALCLAFLSIMWMAQWIIDGVSEICQFEHDGRCARVSTSRGPTKRQALFVAIVLVAAVAGVLWMRWPL